MENVFFCNFSLYNIFLYFAIYSFFGWCTEVIYAAVTTGKFVNRGFLNGPLCPIYGVGMVTVILCLTPLKENLPLLFFGSVLLASVIEYVTGFILEKVFHDQWWDYSDMPFNLHGYICLKFSLLWGIACLLVMKMIHPLVSGMSSLVPFFLGKIFLLVFVILFVSDFISTVVSITKLNVRLKQLDEISTQLKRNSDKFGKLLSEEALELKEKYDLLLSKRVRIHSRIFKAFPNFKSVRYDEMLKELREKLEKSSKKNL